MNWSTEKLQFDNKQIIRDKVLSGLTGGEFEFPTSKPYYRNDRRMRAPNVTFDYTQEEIKSLAILEKDPAYLVNLINSTQMVAVLLGPPTGLVLRDYQKEALDNYQNKRFNIIISARQMGIKHMLAIEALHYAITHTDKSVVIYSRNSASAEDILDKVKEFYKEMPYYSKPGIKEFTQKKVIFDNGSRIFAKPLTKNISIGFTIDFMIINDYAFVTPTIAKPMMQTMFPIMNAISNSKITIASTPNGSNHFKDLVFDDKNAYHKQWMYYHQVPGRNQAWVDSTISDLGSLEAFIQEYELLFRGSKEWIRRLNIDKLV